VLSTGTYLTVKGILPALLRVLACKKAQFTPMILYLRWYRSCTIIGCAANCDISPAVYFHEIGRYEKVNVGNEGTEG
jgi:hypothetical protein